jgi:hypothetical protein
MLVRSGKLPMSSDSDHIRSLDTVVKPPSSDTDRAAALEDGHFRYRGAIGELIWAMISHMPWVLLKYVSPSSNSVNFWLTLAGCKSSL